MNGFIYWWLSIYNTTSNVHIWVILSSMKIHMADILSTGIFQYITWHLASSAAEFLSIITWEIVQQHTNYSQYISNLKVMLHYKHCDTPIMSFRCDLTFWVTLNYQLIVVTFRVWDRWSNFQPHNLHSYPIGFQLCNMEALVNIISG